MILSGSRFKFIVVRASCVEDAFDATRLELLARMLGSASLSGSEFLFLSALSPKEREEGRLSL